MTTLEPVRMAKEVGEEYSSSLADLTMNSKPLINMLTILAEESIEHAAVIVQSVEKHLDKVRAEIKLPVLYLVDSIIKNVGGAYTQLFAQIIVNMFCKVFKQVDEKTRSQMFKLRETWHDVFPTVKLYQLDVKVNLIDPAWPIQARPTQSNIHVNPNFLNRAVPTTTNAASTVAAVSAPGLTPEEIKMREAVARKQHELKMIEMELQRKEKELMEQKRALEKKAASQQQIIAAVLSNEPSLATHTKQRSLTPSATPAVIQPVAPRIAPVNPALLSTARRKDPRLAHLQTNSSQAQIPLVQESQQPPTVKLTDPRTFRKPESVPSVCSPSKQEKSPNKHSHRHSDKKKNTTREHLEKSRETSDVVKINRIDKLPPIPKIKPSEKHSDKQTEQVSSSSPTKRKKEVDSPKSNRKHKKSKDISPKDLPETKVHRKSSEEEGRKQKIKKFEPDAVVEIPAAETFKEIKRRSKERNYIRRNREKSESPEDVDLRLTSKTTTATVPESNGPTSGDVDLRTLPPAAPVVSQRKRSPQEPVQHEPNKKSKSGKLDELFGNEDVDLRTLPVVDEPVRPIIDRAKSPSSSDTKSSAPITVKNRSSHKKDEKDSEEEDEGAEDESSLGDIKNVEGGWAKVKEIQSPQVVQKQPSLSNLDTIRAKLASATKKDGLGRLKIFSSDENGEKKKINSKDTDMRLKNKLNLEGNSIDNNIQIIMTQAEEELQSGNLNKDQYNILLMQVLQLNERQKLKEAKQKESLEASKRRLQWLQQKKANEKSNDIVRERSSSPESVRSADSPIGPVVDSAFGDIDERVPPNIAISNSPANSAVEANHANQKDYDMRKVNQIQYKIPDSHLGGENSNHKDVLIDNAISHDNNVPLVRPEMNRIIPPKPENMYPGLWAPRGFPPRGFRGPRPRNEEWAGPRGFRGRGPMGGNWRMPMGNRGMPDVPERMPLPPPSFFPVEPRKGSFLGPNPLPPYIRDEMSSPPPIGLFPTKEFIRVNPQVLEYMQRDTMKSISIDGVTRDIRFYDKTAIVLLDWDDPREIFFQPGQRRLCIDDQTISLQFNQDYSTFSLDGILHRIKFGSPTRELFIDDMWFECFFGGPPIPILLDGKVRLLAVDGPPPQVTIGDKKLSDLCAGKINMVIDAINTAPIFLDAKPQLVEIGGVPHSLRFVDALETVLINEKPYRVEFGGLPKPFTVNKNKHYIRFTVLPRTIKAGAVNIANMEGKKPDPMVLHPVVPTLPTTGTKVDPERSNTLGGLDMLASILPSSVAPSPQAGSYSALSLQTAEPKQTDDSLKNIDIGSLFAKLVETGILQNPVVTKPPKKSPTDKSEVENKKVETKSHVEIPPSNKNNALVLPVNLNKPETLKTKQPGLVSILHSGMQCGSCGARFPPEHTTRYSQHLDWHFRQNRAEKDSQRRPHSRRWYYDISDWVQFEEIEDLEEREKSWFEKQQEEGAAVETSETSPALQEEVAIVAPPPCAPPNQFKCGHCGDPFHQFYNQELEEWQLRRAVTFENNNYHPDCLEEYKEGLADKIVSDADETIKTCKDENILSKEENEWEDEDQEQMDSSSDVKLVPEEQEVISEDKENHIDDDAEDESIVEVLSEKSQEEVEEVDLIDDDDVVIKTEPVVEITVDDVDTDEETEKERAARDEQFEIDFSKIKIKQEPVDPDDEPVITSEEIIKTHADTTHAEVISSIDGNVQLQPAAVQNTTAPAKIRINITKTLVPAGSPSQKANDHVEPQETPNEDSSNAEEEPEYTLKSSLEGITFTKYPPVTRGNELSGLCSLM